MPSKYTVPGALPSTMPCGYTKSYTFTGENGAPASAVRTTHPRDDPGDACDTIFQPPAPGIGTSPENGGSWSIAQSLSSVMPDGSFGHEEPVTLLTVTSSPLDVVVLPAASRATAVSVWRPLAIDVVSHVTANGVAATSAPRFAPSTLNCTPATPTLSDAVAVTATEAPETVAPAAGAVIATAGGVVSAGPEDARQPM